MPIISGNKVRKKLKRLNARKTRIMLNEPLTIRRLVQNVQVFESLQ